MGLFCRELLSPAAWWSALPCPAGHRGRWVSWAYAHQPTPAGLGGTGLSPHRGLQEWGLVPAGRHCLGICGWAPPKASRSSFFLLGVTPRALPRALWVRAPHRHPGRGRSSHWLEAIRQGLQMAVLAVPFHRPLRPS